jgi:hypothetical protein
MAHKLDIFDVMAAIDKRDKGFLERKTPEERKGFVAPVALRWASAVQGPEAADYLILVNEFANPHFHDLYEHPELQFKLLTLAGSGRVTGRHKWIPVAKAGRSATILQEFIGRFYPFASNREIDMLLDLHTPETFSDFLNQSGCTPEEAKDIISAFNKKSGIGPKKTKSG